MGCHCSKDQNQNDQNINIDDPLNSNSISDPNNNNKHILNNNCDDNDYKCLHPEIQLLNNSHHKDYSQEVFSIINKVRMNPSSFVLDIEKAISNIKESKGKLIYASNVKVSLFKGEEAFRHAASVLNTMLPMNPLEYDEDLAIECPVNELEIKDAQVFMNKVMEKKKSTILDCYFKDAVKDPYTSALLIIVDDSRNNSGKKRETVLNRDYRHIAITSNLVNKSFCAYFTFSR